MNTDDNQIICGTPGEHITTFLDKIENLRMHGQFVTAKFNNVVFSTSKDVSAFFAYREAEMKHRKLIEAENEADMPRRKLEAIRKIDEIFNLMIESASEKEDKLSEEEIMMFLGKAAYESFELKANDKLNTELCQKVIRILENSGYQMCPKEKAYRMGKNPLYNEEWYVIDQSFICASKDNLPNDENLASYAIETAMTQLSENTIYPAMYSFYYIYDKHNLNKDTVGHQK